MPLKDWFVNAGAWRDAQSPAQRGCGCVTLIALGLLCLAFMFGGMMGDYIGPPEGAAEYSRL
jgi:hypothetical protein